MTSPRYAALLSTTLVLALAGCGAPAEDSSSGTDAVTATTADTDTFRPGDTDDRVAIRASLRAGRPVRVIVSFDEARAAAPPPGLDGAARAAWTREAVQRLGDSVVAPMAGMRLERRWSHVPAAVVTLDGEPSVDALLARPGARAIALDRDHTTTLTNSLALIQQPAALSAGARGAGVAVAVLDTGADWGHADLGSCTALGTPATCRVPYALDFAPEDGSRDDNGHGTNVSAIVAQVAPDADIIPLDVFNGGSASSTDIISAINWVVANQATYNIVAMNLSLGSGSYTGSSACSDTLYGGAFTAARNAGVLPIAASGNNGYTNAIAQPACIPEVMSVGAVYDANVGGVSYPSAGCTDSTTAADRIACFSNARSSLTILAPGAAITAGGRTMSGTSQAAPHVAGVAALVKSSASTLTVAQLWDRLVTTGTSIYDSRNGNSFRRVNAAAAVSNCSASLDSTSASVGHGGGSGTVQLTIPTGCTWTLASNASWLTTNPTGTGTGSRTITWTAAANSGSTRSGTVTVAGQVLTVTQAATSTGTSTGTSTMTGTGTSTMTGTGTYTGTETRTDTTTGTGTTTETATYTSTETWTATATGTGTDDWYEGPSEPCVGTVCINEGATYTRNTRVRVAFNLPSSLGVTQMCVSARTTCTSWVTYAATTTSTVSGSGARTIYASFRNAQGSVVAGGSDSIIVDRAKPTDGGSFTATGTSTTLALAWGEASDALSGVASYKVVSATSATAPATCAAGTTVYTGTDTETTLTGLTDGTTYRMRLCAYDAAGNVSRGTTLNARPAPEYDAPTGTIVLNGGATWTGSTTVSVAVTASDDSGVSSACFSDTSRCSTFRTYATTMTATLSARQGEHVVGAWFRDVYNNESASAAATATIRLDTRKPSNGVVTTSGDDGEVTISWSGFADDGSGVDGYRIMQAAGNAPANCTTGTPAATADDTASSVTITGLTNGTTYGFRVCAVDAVGNVGTGTTASGRPASEYDAPTGGSVTINGSDAATGSTSVSLSLSASDPSGIGSMCISWTDTCSTWVDYSSTATSSIARRTTGEKTVKAWFRDRNGNTSEAATDTILLDVTKPTDGSVTATAIAGETTVSLSFTGFTDAHSGVASYVVRGASGTRAPSSCTAGTLAYDGTAGIVSVNLSGPMPVGGTVSFRVCARDDVGNLSTGATVTATGAAPSSVAAR